MEYTGHDTHEGRATSAIEKRTSDIPSIGYLGLATASMVLSAAAQIIFKRRNVGTFIGLWVPSFMLMGLYNKIVKMERTMEERQLH